MIFLMVVVPDSIYMPVLSMSHSQLPPNLLVLVYISFKFSLNNLMKKLFTFFFCSLFTLLFVSQVTDLKLSVDLLEKERDFYFSKLRDIEILCQTSELENEPVRIPAKACIVVNLLLLLKNERFLSLPVIMSTYFYVVHQIHYILLSHPLINYFLSPKFPNTFKFQSSGVFDLKNILFWQ